MGDIVDRMVIEAARTRYVARKDDPIQAMESAKATGDAASLNRMDELPRYVNRFVQLGRPDMAAELIQEASAGGVPRRSALERIIQQNELMAVAFFARGVAAARAVGRVVIRDAAGRTRGHGTGFMISPRLLMTNNHVLSSSQSAATSLIEFDYALGIDGKPMVPSRFRLEPETFFATSIPLDFTITAVEQTNQEGDEVEGRGWIHLIAESGKAIAGEPINIIQQANVSRLRSVRTELSARREISSSTRRTPSAGPRARQH